MNISIIAKMFISPNVTLAIFALILVISAVIAWRMKSYRYYDASAFHTFIGILAGLGVFVTFMFYYNLVEIQQQQQILISIQQLAKINDTMSDEVLKVIQDNSSTIPNFIASITPLTNKACCDSSPQCLPVQPPDPVNVATCTQKMAISYSIFSMWRNVILFHRFAKASIKSYIIDFLQRSNSEQLYKEWKAIYVSFDPKTQQFGELLFRYGLQIKEQVPQSYIDAADRLMEDPEFKSILS